MSDQISSETRKKQIESARKRVTKRERMMTDKESSDLLESAANRSRWFKGQFVCGRISVRQALPSRGHRTKPDTGRAAPEGHAR